MKSYHSKQNLVQGTSILEDILESKSKMSKLFAMLDKFKLKINPSADIRDKDTPWIICQD